MAELPDFLQLDKPAREREENRQDKLRREFHSRARQSGAEIEAARAIIIEPELRTALKTNPIPEEKTSLLNRLADNLSQQGRFFEAAATAVDKDIKDFNQKAADAVFEGQTCSCEPPIETVQGRNLRLPKYRIVKEIYSLKAGRFGYLVECGTCGNWMFSDTNPIPQHSGKPVSDLERLRA